MNWKTHLGMCRGEDCHYLCTFGPNQSRCRNVPNDIPVCTLQAMYNEALITMFAGFHPDSFWDPSDYADKLSEVPEEKEMPKEDSKENVNSMNSSGDMSELKKVIEMQGKELVRLRTLVECKNSQ